MNNNFRIGLALSGGGYRAAAYHLGTLKTLNKLGLLDKVDVISSVSGGSILAAYYALHKNESFDEIEKNFKKCLSHCSLWGAVINLLIIAIALILIFIYTNGYIFTLSIVIVFLFGFKLIPSSKWIAYSYNKIFFKGKKLSDLPDIPVIGINSTDITTGTLFTFSKQSVGGYYYRNKQSNISYIDPTNIPIAFAVSCSTCVPSFFSPLEIDKSYWLEHSENFKPILVDGGLYDNQGAYILSQGSNKLYRTNTIIISDAGNTRPAYKKLKNTIGLVLESVEILMNRIRTIQIRDNIYKASQNDSPYFAYVSLSWGDWNSMPSRFMYNVLKGNVSDLVLHCHGIPLSLVQQAQNKDISAQNKIIELYKESINWESLLKEAQSEYNHKKALSICTNLIPLSDKEINVLMEHSQWLSELQIKTYLPHLL